ncbi:hypothetical protein B0J12DRAFT_776577 [Macrophomina phaseolina]|uniref:Uncharacterized protein n=1 Tax=Macrophomina phaseolina TaxID=35725 RepID=A0ABQ8GJZ2_9PEZI|nr:hypothetical protein B0J12DRAFT_776577 [Macrophomina phaseolina]
MCTSEAAAHGKYTPPSLEHGRRHVITASRYPSHFPGHFIGPTLTKDTYAEAAKEMSTFLTEVPDPRSPPTPLSTDEQKFYGWPLMAEKSGVNINDIDFVHFERLDRIKELQLRNMAQQNIRPAEQRELWESLRGFASPQRVPDPTATECENEEDALGIVLACAPESTDLRSMSSTAHDPGSPGAMEIDGGSARASTAQAYEEHDNEKSTANATGNSRPLTSSSGAAVAAYGTGNRSATRQGGRNTEIEADYSIVSHHSTHGIVREQFPSHTQDKPVTFPTTSSGTVSGGAGAKMQERPYIEFGASTPARVRKRGQNSL